MLKEISEKKSPIQWRVVRTMPRAERLAVQELVTNGFEPYCPQIKTKVSNTGPYTPLFPGYIFVKEPHDKEEELPIFVLPHVYGWLHFSGIIPTVPDTTIKELSEKVEEINNDGGIWHKYEVGDIVTVTFCGTNSLGEVLSVPKTYMKPIDVLLDFMGRDVKAKVSMDKINPVSSDSGLKYQRLRRSRGKGRPTKQYRDIQSSSLVSA